MKNYIEITREMIEGRLNDELELMFNEEQFKPSASEHFKKIGSYDEFFENYLINNHIKVIDGKYYEPNNEEKINGKLEFLKKTNIVSFKGKKYKKVYDLIGSDPKETCMKNCVFCKMDENGEPECGAPLTKSFWDCEAGFHWEEEK